jgi:hypothetical protein
MKNQWLQIAREHQALNLAGKKVIVRERRNGKLEILRGQEILQSKVLPERPQEAAAPKIILRGPIRPNKPAQDHPWKWNRMASGMTSSGMKILLNDTANPNALKSFVSRSGGGATPTISISSSQTGIVITFTGHLYSADKVERPYTQVQGTGSVTVNPTAAAKFYQSGP